jgi:hypothetical protein
MAETLKAQFGLPQEWNHFAESHGLFLEHWQNLRLALETAFIRTGTTSEPVDRVVFFAGRLCAEDFLEILLLCGNGYGIGAMKILRGMYELAVTARYLHANPAETDAFLDFYWISQYRLAQAISETFGHGVLPPDRVEELKAKRDEVREQFLVTTCRQCGTKAINYSWSKLDFVSMARKTGSLGTLIVPAYYLPTREAHGTIASIFSRLKQGEGGDFDFDEGPQREEADQALITAHNVLLNVLDLQKEHFHLDVLDGPLQRCFQDFLAIWKRNSEGQEPNV